MSPGRASAAALALLAAACATPEARPSASLSDGRYLMGTVLELTLHGPDARRLERARDALFAEVRALERRFSRYLPESDVSRLNRTAGSGPQRVDPEVARIVADSLAYSRLTRGSFDVTVGPLVALWTDAAAADSPPTREEIARARSRVGADLVRVGSDGTVEIRAEGASIDLGGVAKGYALDRVRPLLREHGVRAALLNFGRSSTWAIGAPPDAPAWRLLVRGPDEGVLGVIALRDQALSVSGSLGQWVEIGGRRYGHVLDPRSGRPLTRRREALVLAPSAALAEALSKALLILGEREGVALVDGQPGCEGLLADADGSVWTTAGFAREARFEPVAGAP